MTAGTNTPFNPLQQTPPAQSGTTNQDPAQNTTPVTTPDPKPTNFDDWIKAQPTEVQELIENRTAGLKNALTSERESRKTAEKSLREMASRAEQGSAAQQELTRMADELKEAERRLSFYDEAQTQNVKNAKLAYMAAVQDGLITDTGKVKWDELKTAYPELFRQNKPQQIPEGNAGAGTTAAQQAPATFNMNQMIRQGSGRRG